MAVPAARLRRRVRHMLFFADLFQRSGGVNARLGADRKVCFYRAHDPGNLATNSCYTYLPPPPIVLAGVMQTTIDCVFRYFLGLQCDNSREVDTPCMYTTSGTLTYLLFDGL